MCGGWLRSAGGSAELRRAFINHDEATGLHGAPVHTHTREKSRRVAAQHGWQRLFGTLCTIPLLPAPESPVLAGKIYEPQQAIINRTQFPPPISHNCLQTFFKWSSLLYSAIGGTLNMLKKKFHRDGKNMNKFAYCYPTSLSYMNKLTYGVCCLSLIKSIEYTLIKNQCKSARKIY